MLHIGWRQIYEGYDMVLVGKIKEELEGENIDYKVEADNTVRSRMSRDVLFGGDPMVLNGVGARAVTQYSIYVRKDQEEYAIHVIQTMKRD